jgi:hypothetical protein
MVAREVEKKIEEAKKVTCRRDYDTQKVDL